MPRLSLSEAVMKVASVQRLRAHGAKALSRAKREQLAPKPPSAAEQKYLRLMRAYTREVERLTREILLPALPPEPRNDVKMDAEKNLDDAFASLNSELLVLADKMAPAIAEVGRAVTKHANKEVARMLNIDLRGGEVQLESYVAEFVAQNIRLVKSVSFDQLDKLREIVSANQAQGAGVRPLREQLMDSFGLTRARANLIARDQVLKAAAQTNELRQKQVGVTSYTWSSSRDERVREDHAALDGQVIEWSNPPVVDQRTGRRAHAGQDYQCRCTAVANVAGLLGQ